MSKNILISTLGASWEIIPETLGAFLYDKENPEMDFYGKNPEAVKDFREKANQILAGNSIDELWLLSTNPKGVDDIVLGENGKPKELSLKGMLRQIDKWRKSYSPVKNLAVKVWALQDVADIKSKSNVDEFHDMALRIMAYSRKYADGGKRIVSLACGRKTMSADIQDAAYCFGCDMMMHVVAGNSAYVDLHGKSVLNESVASSIFPVELKPFPASDLFEDWFAEDGFMKFPAKILDLPSTPQKENYFKGDLFLCKAQEPAGETFLAKVQKKREAAKHFYSSFFSSQQYNYDTFPILYTLSKQGQESLKAFKIGVDPQREEKDLAWLQEMPKSDLHFHLGGSLSVEEIVKVATAIKDKVKIVCGQLPKFAEAALAGPKDCEEKWKTWRTRVAKLGAAEAVEKEFYDACKKNELAKILEAYVAPIFILKFENNPQKLEEFVYGPVRNKADLRIEENFLRISAEKKDKDGNVVPGERDLTPYEVLGDLQGTSLMRHRETIRKTMEILFENARKNNLKYIEIRCSPINYSCGELRLDQKVVSAEFSSKDVVEEILKAMKSAEECDGDSRVYSSMIFIASRHGSRESVVFAIDLYKSLKDDARIGGDFSSYFRGFDLAGDEGAKSPKEMRESFEEILKDCLSITIHAGETMPVENIWEAVYALSAERVGHGLKLKDNSSLRDKFRDRRIGVEMCPSSNYQIVGFMDNYYPDQSLDGKSISCASFEYPLKMYMEKNLRVCINTDDPGISRTNITNELLRAARLTRGGLSLWEIFSLLYNGFDLAFLPYNKKLDLLNEMNGLVKAWLDCNISKIENEVVASKTV